MAGLFISAVLIVIFQILWSPKLLRRYCEDYLWLLAILVFLTVGFRYRAADYPSRYAGAVCWLSIMSFFISCIIFLISEEASLTVTQPEILQQIVRILSLGTHGA